MKHDKILAEAAFSKMTVEDALRFASIFCDRTNWGTPPNSECEAMTVLAAEVIRLRELVRRARDMIDVSPDSPPWTWPSVEQIDQLVNDCDAVLGEKKS
jgi:hypothetical protein